MRLPLVLGALVAAAFFAAPTSQAKAAYCLNDDDGGAICGFISVQQCLISASGRGGTCEPDLRATPSPRDDR